MKPKPPKELGTEVLLPEDETVTSGHGCPEGSGTSGVDLDAVQLEGREESWSAG
jgi:hypothetical protein